MRMHYSHEANALYIRLKENKIENTDEVSDDIIMDYDKDGNVVGIEVLSATSKVDIGELLIQSFDKVMVEHPMPLVA